MKAQSLLAAAAALLVAVQAIRLAIVDALADRAPAVASRIWGNHPDVQLSAGMTAIAVAAREGRPVSSATLEPIYTVARIAPLSVEPFLVRAVQAQLAGDLHTAERALVAAKWRNGRSLPVRYFLADHYLQRGAVNRGLAEIGVLARLAPDGVANLAPYVATFAQDRGSWRHVRALFRAQPALEDATLRALARDPRNADLVIALAGPARRNAKSVWLPDLLTSLVNAGQFAKARAAWAKVSQVSLDSRTLLYDPEFKRKDAPPPFNWSLTSSGIGLTDRQRGGGLRVIFYGREDGVLAKQLLVLPPGQYRLSMKAAGNTARVASLVWTVACASTNATVASRSLYSTIENDWLFTVPRGCPAQWLQLVGSSSDMPRQSELTVRSVNLVREPLDG